MSRPAARAHPQVGSTGSDPGRLNGVKTEGFADLTTTLVIGVAEGDVVDVTSGVTTAAFTVTGCLNDNGDGFE
jgi:hypothetical protein